MTLSRDQVLPSESDMEAASDWLLRLTSGTATEGDLAGFKAWRDADVRHRAAFAEVRDLWNDLEGLRPGSPQVEAADVIEMPRMKPAPRRGRLALGGLLAACLALFAVFAGDIATAIRADYRTAVGEQATVRLPDGSTVYLNTDSAIALAYSEGRREVVLLRGEALFDVVKDAARPFQVSGLGGSSTALGTVFAVQAADERAVVTVVEGRVRVTAPAAGTGPGAGAGASVDLSRNRQVAYAAGGSPGAVLKVDAAKLTAWRRGLLYIDGLSLEAALAEIDRYHPGRIVLLAGPRGGEPVTARIALDQIDSGIKALAATHGLEVTHLTDFLVVVR